MRRASQFHPARPVKGSRRCHVWGHLRWHWQIDACRANCRVSCNVLACDSCRGSFPLSLIARRKLTVQTPLPSWQRIRAPRMTLHPIAFSSKRSAIRDIPSTSGRRPSCLARGRLFVHSFVSSVRRPRHVCCTYPRRDHLAGLHAHPVYSRASVYKPKRLNAVVKF